MSDHPPLRAIIVCVNYWDFLQITLPFNRHHFSEVMIVTDFKDHKTVDIANDNDCRVHKTDAFYYKGSSFAKWRALEEAFDVYGRYGWLVNMDSDVLWPPTLPDDFTLEVGKLYTPLRHMFKDMNKPIPKDPKEWPQYQIHRNIREWAGYSQIFHADDPHLPTPPPWFDVSWKHAGGADSFFQRMWEPHNKIRPSWNCLHIGPDGSNWSGRASMFLDGTEPPDRQKNREAQNDLATQRRSGQSRIGDDPFGAEKVQ